MRASTTRTEGAEGRDTELGSSQRITFEFDATDEFRGVAPFELIRSRETRREGDLVTLIALDRKGAGYVARVTKGDQVRTASFEEFDYTLAGWGRVNVTATAYAGR